MSKKILIIFSFVLILILASCTVTAEVDVNSVMADVNNRYQFDNMIVLSSVDELEKYFIIDADSVKSFSAQISSDSSVLTEIIFVQAVDKDSASEIATLLNNHYQSRLSEAKSYNPESVKILESCSVEQKGTYVSLIIDDKAQEIKEIYNSYFE